MTGAPDEIELRLLAEASLADADVDRMLAEVPRLVALRERARAFDARVRAAIEITPSAHLVERVLAAVPDEDFDRALNGAVAVAAPAGLERRILDAVRLGPGERRTAWWRPVFALAALALLAFGSFGVWRQYEATRALTDIVIAHIQHEPQALVARSSVSIDDLAASLRRVGIDLADADAREALTQADIRYLKPCPIRNHPGMHLVAYAAGRPVTILVMPFESLGNEKLIDDPGFKGLIRPSPHGSFAVVGESREDVHMIMGKVDRGFVWM
ncbi:MAG: DUF3379 family protein [Chromatiales bacterium]|nr:DUF3379 family protein [Chromatiales bacterium]